MKRMTLVFAIVLSLAAPTVAFAGGGPDNPKCWGVVTSQRAVSEGDIGEHSAAQEVPRMGLGNFARFLFEAGLTEGPHISDTGSVAAELDELESTSCP
jgi:hypothetical protein